MARMRLLNIILLSLSATLLSGCAMMTGFSDENASGYRQMEREQCVPYARRESGINLRGDAWTWWNAAAGKYQRGNRPEPGAMLVLAKTSRLRSGHLAVVKEIVGPRKINVTHTNWGDDFMSRRIVYESMLAEDVSTTNDWTQIRFWNREHDVLGSPYLAKGFIYNRPESRVFVGEPVMPAYPVTTVTTTTTIAPTQSFTPMPKVMNAPPSIPMQAPIRRPAPMRPILD